MRMPDVNVDPVPDQAKLEFRKAILGQPQGSPCYFVYN